MLLPLAQSWPIRCAKCGHTAVITATFADLAERQLRCGCCGHRPAFEPSTIVRAPGRTGARREKNGGRLQPLSATDKVSMASEPLLNDRLDDAGVRG